MLLKQHVTIVTNKNTEHFDHLSMQKNAAQLQFELSAYRLLDVSFHLN